MNLLCQQIGLNTEGEARDATYYTVRQILKGLRNYNDGGPVSMNGPGRLRTGIDAEGDPDYAVFMATLNTLVNQEIILFKFTNTNYTGRDRATFKEFSVFVINRYKLELLHAELKWLRQGEDKRTAAPHVANLVYYNPLSGKGSVNGKPILLRKSKRKNMVKAKEIFDLLFASAPNPVPRQKIAEKLGLDKNSPDETDRITQALSNLRRRCGVTKSVIYMRQGSAVLDAIIVPIDKLPDIHSFPE